MCVRLEEGWEGRGLFSWEGTHHWQRWEGLKTWVQIRDLGECICFFFPFLSLSFLFYKGSLIYLMEKL